MVLSSYFSDFLARIRLQQNHIDDCKCGHQTLRERLAKDADLSPIIVSDFLQGSYRRATAIKPKNGKRADVDIIVVTKLSQEEYPDPDDAMDIFEPFLKKHYEGKYRRQGRSFGIELSYVDLDLVITSAPSEAEIDAFKSEAVKASDTPDDTNDWRLVESWVSSQNRNKWNAEKLLVLAKSQAEWQLSPLYIPDRDTASWEPTHPLEQIRKTWEKNKMCNRHYVNVVKALKWWRRVKCSDTKYPKGYPVEHLIWRCCPDGIASVDEGVTLTLEHIAADYKVFADHGVPAHNVFARLSGEDFAVFHGQICEAAKIAREALDSESKLGSVKAWQTLFGKEFPDPPSDEDDNTSRSGYSERTKPTVVTNGWFA